MRKNAQFFLSNFIVFALASVILTSLAKADSEIFYEITQITDNGVDDWFPRINDRGHVLWWSGLWSSGQGHMYLKSGDQVLEISNSFYPWNDEWLNDNERRVMSESGQVVYQGNTANYLYYNPDFEQGDWMSYTTRILSPHSDLAGYPQIADNGLVAYVSQDHKIWIWDSNTGQEIAVSDGAEAEGSYQMNRHGDIAWRKANGPPGFFDIYLYRGGTITRLVSNANVYPPRINDSGEVVWSGFDGNDLEIFFYDGSQVIQITYNNYDDWFPELNNYSKVVWIGWDGNDHEVFLYSSLGISQITENSFDDRYPHINDAGKIVWYGGQDQFGYQAKANEIYLYSDGVIHRITNNDCDDRFPQINNHGEIVWQSYCAETSEIFLAKPKYTHSIPVANAGEDQTAKEGTLVRLDGSGSYAPDGCTVIFNWVQIAGATVTLDLADPAHPSFTAPNVAAAGATLTFKLTVGDGELVSEPDTVDIAVFNANQKPIAKAGIDQIYPEGTMVVLDGSLSFDPDGDIPLSYHWTQIGGSPVVIDSPNSITPTFCGCDIPTGGATYTFSLVVEDALGEMSDPSIVNIQFTNVNHPPVADAGNDQTVSEGAPVSLDGSKSYDVDGDSLLYNWSQVSGHSVSLSDSSVEKPTFIAPYVASGSEQITFGLTVSDGMGSTMDLVNVTVENLNHAPTANAGIDQTVQEGAPVSMDGSASVDPDSDLLTYQWTQIDGPSVIIHSKNTAKPTLTAPAVSPGGSAITIKLTVSDGQFSSSDTVQITVLNVNDPPLCAIAKANPESIWPPNHKMVPIQISGVTDPNNDSVTITVTGVTQDEPVNGLGDGDTSPDAAIQGGKLLVRAERSGSGNGRVYHLNFTASDPFGQACTGIVTVCVPHDKGSKAGCIDDGQLYNSFLP
jgi:hypothetical protein